MATKKKKPPVRRKPNPASKAKKYGSRPTINSAYRRAKARQNLTKKRAASYNKALAANTRRLKKAQKSKRPPAVIASIRKDRVQIISKYNKTKKATQKKWAAFDKKLKARLDKLPKPLNSRNLTDIWEHYDIQRTFAMDVSTGAINDIVQGQIPGSTDFQPEEYG